METVKEKAPEVQQELILETHPNDEWQVKLNSLGQEFVIRVLEMTTTMDKKGNPLTTILLIKSTKEFMEQQVQLQAKAQEMANRENVEGAPV